MKTILFFAVMIAFLGCSSQGSVKSPGQQEKSSKNPLEVTLKIMNYDSLMSLIHSYQGKVVVLDIWSTTCGPCLREFPGLVKLHHQYSREEVICISLSVDYLGIQGKPAENYQTGVLRFLNKFGATFDNILAGEESDVMFTKLEIGAPPAVFVYDRQGLLAKRFDNDMALTEEDAFTYQDVGRLVAQLVESTK